MTYGEQGRVQTAAWDDLDALVVEEMEALGGRAHRGPPRPPATGRDAGFPAAESYRDMSEAAEVDEADEEGFMERTVDYLRGRPDAEALLEAIRAALYDQEPAPLGDDPPVAAEEAAADLAGAAPPIGPGAGP